MDFIISVKKIQHEAAAVVTDHCSKKIKMQYHVVETIYTLIFYKLCTKLNYTIRKDQ